MVSLPRCMDGLERLSSLRKICKACPCAKLVCVINADLVVIGHVSGTLNGALIGQLSATYRPLIGHLWATRAR